MIRSAINAVRPVLDLIELGVIAFTTHRLHPLAPQWKRVILRRAELNRRIK
jgi:hypothetical protein